MISTFFRTAKYRSLSFRNCWKFTLSMNSATFFAASRISSRRPGSLYGSLINQDFIMIDTFPGKWLDGSVDDEIDGFSYSVFQL